MAKTSFNQNSDAACGTSLPPLRSYDSVMRLSRMGAFFPHRLSFMRVLIRRLAAQKSEMQMPVCALDQNGFGHVVLSLSLSGRVYSLIAFSRNIKDSERTDRVIATQWDASFCLFDGMPSLADIEQLADKVTHQEAGRYDGRILTLSRANKSLRLFSHVVERLAKGQQPDTDALVATGYLMRTTALTDADTALHKLLSAQLKQLSLTIPVLSEESTTQDIENRLSWPVCWVIDPLDGTKEFIERTDQFTINIALVIGGFSELGRQSPVDSTQPPAQHGCAPVQSLRQ